jgi:hypothetical protein
MYHFRYRPRAGSASGTASCRRAIRHPYTLALFSQPQRADSSGIHQSNVPGAWDGWMLWLDRYGRAPEGPLPAPDPAIHRRFNA